MVKKKYKTKIKEFKVIVERADGISGEEVQRRLDKVFDMLFYQKQGIEK